MQTEVTDKQRKIYQSPQGNAIPLSSINAYGRQISLGASLKGRLSSMLHWSSSYDRRNILDYYVQWAQVNAGKMNEINAPREYGNFFEALKVLEQKDISGVNSRHVATLVDAFKHNREQLGDVFKKYRTLLECKENPSDLDIESYVSAVKNLFAKTDGELQVSAIVKEMVAAKTRLTGELKGDVYDGFVWEASALYWGYFYDALTFLKAALPVVLFESFWPFFLTSVLADLSVPLAGGFIKGMWSKLDEGSFTEMLKAGYRGAADAWNDLVDDENSFHPVVDAVLGGLYITVTWLYLDKVIGEAGKGSLLEVLNQYNVLGYVPKYASMHAYFSAKAAIHKAGTVLARAPFSAALQGAYKGLVRGTFKNLMALPLAGASKAEGLLKGATNAQESVWAALANANDTVRAYYDILITNVALFFSILLTKKRELEIKEKVA